MENRRSQHPSTPRGALSDVRRPRLGRAGTYRLRDLIGATGCGARRAGSQPGARVERFAEGFMRQAAASRRRSRRAVDPSRTPHRHGETPTGRTQARPQADPGWRGRRPSPDVLTQAGVPTGARRRKRDACEAFGRRVRVGVKRRLVIARITGPPADRDLLRVHRVAHDEVIGGRLGRPAGEQIHRQVERTPPRVDRRRAPTVRRTKRRKHYRACVAAAK